METSETPPFSIGQKVVVVDNSGFEHRMNMGDVHTVKHLKKLGCGCWVVDVGIRGGFYCPKHCHCEMNTPDVWLYASRFDSAKEDFKAVAYSSILESVKLSCN